MSCLFAGALVFALATQDFRRHNDKGITQGRPKRRPPLDDTSVEASVPTSPAKLAALGWLPPETNLIVGIHVQEIAKSQEGSTVLAQPLVPALFNSAKVNVRSLIEGMGFHLEEIDHVVLGVKVDDFVFPTSMPRFILLVRTRQELDPVDFVKRLRAERVTAMSQRAVYEFRATEGLKPALCFLDPRTVAFALVPNHLRDIPTTADTNLKQLPRETRDVLQQRLVPGGPLWIVGQPDDWNEKALKSLTALTFKNLRAADRQAVSKVRAFAAWVQSGDPVLVRATFDCGADSQAQELQTLLRIPDAGAGRDWFAVRNDGWLTLQLRSDWEQVRQALER